MDKMVPPLGCTSCSFEGEEFTADEVTGLVAVPPEAVGVLLSHGFTVPDRDALAAADKALADAEALAGKKTKGGGK